ncbi:hypothetical protein pdam_00021240 [Pocillopora damicornis]|uniref:Peptidase S8 pro-domain domain-containing protein n=1 Tax=Pocillopora damicornis TaxID=46731 RepID=A0A3M6UNU0_POCDA|nr:hypothetical protein pdam_00021240 [Pocillopora damicornis]
MAWYSSSTSSIVRPFSCVLFIILYCGNGVIVDAIFTNLWAVKVRGSQQEAEELAHKHGFSYDKHASGVFVAPESVWFDSVKTTGDFMAEDSEANKKELKMA